LHSRGSEGAGAIRPRDPSNRICWVPDFGEVPGEHGGNDLAEDVPHWLAEREQFDLGAASPQKPRITAERGFHRGRSAHMGLNTRAPHSCPLLVAELDRRHVAVRSEFVSNDRERSVIL
jgi:hypothetical protein